MFRQISHQLSYLAAILLLLTSVFATVTERAAYLEDGRVLPFFSNKKDMARGYFVESINETGWNQLHIVVSEAKPLEDQFYAAGYLEGFLTAKYIIASLHTSVRSFYSDARESGVDWHVENAPNDDFPADFPHELTSWAQRMWDFALSLEKTNPNDLHVQQILLHRKQLEGMLAGIHAKVKSSAATIRFEHLLLLNSAGDYETILGSKIVPDNAEARAALGDLRQFHGGHSSMSYLTIDRQLHCSALARAEVDDTGAIRDIYLAHDTWSSYFTMNRMLKQITFAPVEADVRSHHMAKTVIMSSYPATLYSMDDFYVTSNRLGVIETTYHCFDEERNNKYIVDESLPTWLRATAAVRFSDNSDDFERFMAFHNSGTYNNGYLVVDMKAFNNPAYTYPLITDVEQLPGIVKAVDFTDRFLTNGWLPSLNAPLDDDMYRLAGYVDVTANGDDYFNREGSRFKIYQREITGGNVNTYADFQALMVRSQYDSEPLAGDVGEYDPGSVIYSRYDKRDNLVTDPADGKTKLGGLVYGRFHGRALMGGLDSKTVRLSSLLSNAAMTFDTHGGPTHDFIDPKTGAPAKPFNFDMLGLDVVDGAVVPNPTKYDSVLKYSLIPREWNFGWMSFTEMTTFPGEKANPYKVTAVCCLVAVLVIAAVVAAYEVFVVLNKRRGSRKVNLLEGEDAKLVEEED